MLQISKTSASGLFLLLVMIAYAFDFGNLKYAIGMVLFGGLFLGSGLYEKRRLKGIGKEYLLIFGGITFLFVITAIFANDKWI